MSADRTRPSPLAPSPSVGPRLKCNSGTDAPTQQIKEWTVTQAPDDLGIDLMAGTFYEREPHDAYAWMRANAPVYYDEPNDLWGVASYAGVKAGLGRSRGVLERPGDPAQERPAPHDDRLRRPRARTAAPAGLRRVHPPSGCGPWKTTCALSATP